jgi:hypothetical protein
MIKRTFTLAIACAFALPAMAADPALPAARLREVAAQVSPERLRATIEKLVSFGTRHTLSTTTDEKRGIGAARRWTAGEFAAISAACGGCLQLMQPAESYTGTRIPQPAEIVNVLAVQTGTSEPDRVVIISGHIDSRVNDVMDSSQDAPGANDDGSGTAAVIEAARVLSRYKFPATIVYAVLSGEEQGLYGGRLLAKTAKERGWQVEAQLNNDIIGNSHGYDGKVDATHFRLFSEGVHVNESEKEARQRRLMGGEVDSPSRNLARLVGELAAATLKDFHPKLIYRADRLGRGGDQGPMQEAGYTAIRITEAVENYNRQHQDVRMEKGIAYGDVVAGVDFAYLANMTRVNVVALADMAWAPAPPPEVKIAGAVSPETSLSWTDCKGAAGYWVRWRDTDLPAWKEQIYTADTKTVVKEHVVDDFSFGVAAVSPEGFVSPTRFADVR